MSLRGGRPFRMSGSCLEALSDVREALRMLGSVWDALPALSDVREKSAGPPGCLGVGGSPPECPGVNTWPAWMSGSVWEALPDIRGC